MAKKLKKGTQMKGREKKKIKGLDVLSTFLPVIIIIIVIIIVTSRINVYYPVDYSPLRCPFFTIVSSNQRYRVAARLGLNAGL